MAFTYVHPPVDNVASDYYVDVTEAPTSEITGVETVEEAIEVYMQAFQQKFKSPMGRKQRRICLQYFQRYLVAQGHSMKVKELALSDGQHYLGSLRNHYNGLPLKPSQSKKYRSALRSFSRFLHDLRIVEENIFLNIKRT